MSAADWYARKLGGAPPAQPRTSTPQTDQLLPRYAAPGTYPQASQAVAYRDGETEGLQEAPPGQMHAMDAVVRWRGGKGTKTETATCPECGSPNFFSLKEQSKMTQNGPALPAPRCAACGYNGIYAPFGGDLNSVI